MEMDGDWLTGFTFLENAVSSILLICPVLTLLVFYNSNISWYICVVFLLTEEEKKISQSDIPAVKSSPPEPQLSSRKCCQWSSIISSFLSYMAVRII
jgi:hypothetical protein